MKLEHAQNIAAAAVEVLKRHCRRIEIAGSIRRGKADVKDIEIVCIPKLSLDTGDLVYPEYHEPDTGKGRRSNAWCAAVLGLGQLARGRQIGTGKYFKINLKEGIALDLFCAQPHNWGYILLLRTGPAPFSEQFVTRLKRMGRPAKGGHIEGWPCYEEEDAFKAADMDFIEPEKRGL